MVSLVVALEARQTPDHRAAAPCSRANGDPIRSSRIGDPSRIALPSALTEPADKYLTSRSARQPRNPASPRPPQATTPSRARRVMRASTLVSPRRIAWRSDGRRRGRTRQCRRRSLETRRHRLAQSCVVSGLSVLGARYQFAATAKVELRRCEEPAVWQAANGSTGPQRALFARAWLAVHGQQVDVLSTLSQ